MRLHSACRATIDLLWIREGHILVLWLGTPCKFWCIAKTNKEGEGAGVSRNLANFSVRLIHACRQCHVSFVLENSASSKLFEWNPMKSALKRARVESVVFDMCAYGTLYQKPTRLAGTLEGLSSFGLCCWCNVPAGKSYFS